MIMEDTSHSLSKGSERRTIAVVTPSVMDARLRYWDQYGHTLGMLPLYRHWYTRRPDWLCREGVQLHVGYHGDVVEFRADTINLGGRDNQIDCVGNSHNLVFYYFATLSCLC